MSPNIAYLCTAGISVSAHFSAFTEGLEWQRVFRGQGWETLAELCVGKLDIAICLAVTIAVRLTSPGTKFVL